GAHCLSAGCKLVYRRHVLALELHLYPVNVDPLGANVVRDLRQHAEGDASGEVGQRGRRRVFAPDRRSLVAIDLEIAPPIGVVADERLLALKARGFRNDMDLEPNWLAGPRLCRWRESHRFGCRELSDLLDDRTILSYYRPFRLR